MGMKTSATSNASYLFVFGLTFRNGEEDRGSVRGGILRRQHSVDGMSLWAIARKLGHSRKCVKKGGSHTALPGCRSSKSRPRAPIENAELVAGQTIEETRPFFQPLARPLAG